MALIKKGETPTSIDVLEGEIAVNERWHLTQWRKRQRLNQYHNRFYRKPYVINALVVWIMNIDFLLKKPSGEHRKNRSIQQ